MTGDAVEGPSVTAPAPSEELSFEAGAALAAELADDLSAMLRQRIEEALSELDGSLEGSADAAGVAYREVEGLPGRGARGRLHHAGLRRRRARGAGLGSPKARRAPRALGRRGRRRRRLVPRLRRQLARRAAAARGGLPDRARAPARAPGLPLPARARSVVGSSSMRVPTDIGVTIRTRCGATSSGSSERSSSSSVAVIVVQGLANFYTNYLWYRSVQFTTVWRLMVETKLELAAVFVGVFFVACWVSLWVVDRIAPRALLVSPELEIVRRYQQIVGRPHLRLAHSRVADPRSDPRGLDRRPVAALAHVPQRQVASGRAPATPSSARRSASMSSSCRSCRSWSTGPSSRSCCC